MFSKSRSLISHLAGRRATLLATAVVAVAVAPATASAAVTSSVDKKDIYLTKAAESYTFTVNHTETINSFQITRPSTRWTITGCGTAPTNWTIVTAAGSCTYNMGATGAAVPAGAETFTVTATTSAGDNVASAWDVDGDTSGTTFGNPNVVQGSPTVAGALTTSGWNFEIEDAVITNSVPAANSACPAGSKTAPTVSTQIVVICGRQWGAGSAGGATTTPQSSGSNLAGSFIGVTPAGGFASGAIGYGTGGSVVLATYSAAQITSESGTGKDVVVTVGTTSGGNNKTSPATTLTGYEVTKSSTSIDNVSGSGTYGDSGTLTARLNSPSPASGRVAGETIDFTLNGTPVGQATTNASGVASLTGVSLAGKDAGTETGVVGASFTEDTTYTASSNSGNLTVGPRDLDGSFTANDKTYDQSSTATFTPSLDSGDIVSGDDVSITGGTANFADANVLRHSNGTVLDKVVTGSGFDLAGADEANYSLDMVLTDNAKINPVAVNGSFTSEDKTYDGSNAAAVTGRTFDTSQILSGDTADIDTAGTATFASADVARDGNGNVIDQTVTGAGFRLVGAQADNYELTMATTEAAITPKTLGGTFSADSREYNGTTVATFFDVAVVPTDVVGSDVVSIDDTAATAAFGNKNVGTGKTVTGSGFVLDGADAGNYTLSMATATADITTRAIELPADGPATFTAANKPYDGTTAATISGSSFDNDVPGDDVSLTGTATFDNEDVGNDKTVTLASPALTGTDASNYTLDTSLVDGDALANITRKVLPADFTAANKVYDRSNTATVLTRTLTGVVGTEDVSLTERVATFANSAVGNGKTVTLSDPALVGTDSGNYSLGTVDTATANITKKDVTGAFTASNKDFDGNTSATIASRSLSGVISGDTVSLDGGTAAFDDPNPGTGKTVTGSGFTLGGTDAGNYNLASVSTTTATINQRAAAGSGGDGGGGGGSGEWTPSVFELAADILGVAGTKLVGGVDLDGLAAALQSANQGGTVNYRGFALNLMAIGCVSDCVVTGTNTVDLGRSAGASTAATRYLKLGTQRKELKGGELGVLKLKKLTKAQRRAIRRASKPKLIVKIGVTSGGKKATAKKSYRLKLSTKR